MPLDKSRIQGIGSDGSVTGGTTTVKVSSCPQGHALRLWEARQGWCDQCGRKVTKGELVMDCRVCNWYLCDACCPHDKDATAGGFWDTVSAMTEQMAGPAVQSALDSVALRVGDVVDAAAADLTEMATDVKTFVAQSMGLDEDSDEPEKQAPKKKERVSVDPKVREQSQAAISQFCEKYSGTRVAPNREELEDLWAKAGALHAGCIAGAMYDQLSFSNGELAWQPRFRVLCVLEHFHKKGGLGKEIVSGVMSQGAGLVEYLKEVQQCREKAIEVLQMLSGKQKDSGCVADDEGAAKATAKAKAKPKPKPDLLDMDASPVAASGPVDLLGGASPQAAAAPVAVAAPPAAAPAAASGLSLLDGLDMSPPAAAQPSLAGPGSFDPFAASAGASSSTSQPAFNADFNPNQPAAGLSGTNLSALYKTPGPSLGPGAGFPGYAALAGPGSFPVGPGPRIPVAPGPPWGGSAGGYAGRAGNIPAADALSPMAAASAADPFSFVAGHTGIGDAKAKS